MNTSIVVFLLLFSCSWSLASSNVQVSAILESLLGETYPVSYKAEEVVIFFSESEAPRVHRYRTGVLKPDRMRRESYGIDGSVEDIIVHDSEMQIVYYPSEKIVLRSPREKIRTTQLVAEMSRLVKANYDIHIEGEAKVSGRNAFVVSILPKKRGTRPGLRVWMDQDYLIVLKTETYDLEGNISYQNTYKKLTINPSFEDGYFVIMVPPGTAAYESASDLKAYEMSEAYQVSGGYVLKESLRDESGHFQAIYNDGLNNISVFIEDWDERGEINAERMLGRSGAVAEMLVLDGIKGFFCRRGAERFLMFAFDGHKYTIVGEASKADLVEISLDIKKRAKKR